MPPADITVAVNNKKAVIVVIPDNDARRMRTESEAARVVDGPEWTSEFPADSWVGIYAGQILAAVTSHCRSEMAKGASREVYWPTLATVAGPTPRFGGYIVGESGYDFKKGAWRDYDTTTDLHVPGHLWSTNRGAVFGGDVEEWGPNAS